MNWYKKAKADMVNIDDLPNIDEEDYEENGDKDMARARKYFNIGHGDYVEEHGINPDYQVWIMLYGEIQKSKVFKVDPEKGYAVDDKTHGSLWGDARDYNFRGRYEPQTGRLTVVKPESAKFRDIPNEVIGKIRRSFPKAKKIIVI